MNYSKNEIEGELSNCKQQVAQLKGENEELISNLFLLNEKLRDSEGLKGHFISNITNEIINPFASVLALAENIKVLKDGEIAQAHRMADLIFDQAFHLDFQLKNVFAAALIEAGKEELIFSVINMIDLGSHITSYFKTLLKKKTISLLLKFSNELIPGAAIKFSADREKLELIIKNLISNSIKFSPDGSVINLEFRLEIGQLSIVVTDQGKGINPDERKIIFDRFKQLDEKINSINTGHGLGLSIVQAYTEMMGGKVVLKDNDRVGISVIVIIPVNPEAEELDDLEDFIIDAEY